MNISVNQTPKGDNHVGWICSTQFLRSESRATTRRTKGLQADKIFVDKQSSKDIVRPELQKMLNFVCKGDVFVVHSLDRLARNHADLLTMVQELTGRGVSVRFIHEKLDFDADKQSSSMAKLMLSMVGAFAEFERSMIKCRQADGIALAKARDVYKGRQRSVTDAQIEEIRSMMEMGVPLSAAARKVGISRTTAYKYLKNLTV